MILLIDNYDSFSYNLFQLVGELYPDIKVIRNDEMTIDEIRKLSPEKMILSPGPGRPEDAGVTVQTAATLSKEIPTLGVCLGHQAICQAYGASIVHAKQLMHGKQSTVKLDAECPLFKGLPEHTEVARYHSLAAVDLPDCLKAAAVTDEYPIYGVQFHPESILTPLGREMLKNFVEL